MPSEDTIDPDSSPVCVSVKLPLPEVIEYPSVERVPEVVEPVASNVITPRSTTG